jgi:hypothetical protein
VNGLGFCPIGPARGFNWFHDGCLPFGWEKKKGAAIGCASVNLYSYIYIVAHFTG